MEDGCVDLIPGKLRLTTNFNDSDTISTMSADESSEDDDGDVSTSEYGRPSDNEETVRRKLQIMERKDKKEIKKWQI